MQQNNQELSMLLNEYRGSCNTSCAHKCMTQCKISSSFNYAGRTSAGYVITPAPQNKNLSGRKHLRSRRSHWCLIIAQLKTGQNARVSTGESHWRMFDNIWWTPLLLKRGDTLLVFTGMRNNSCMNGKYRKNSYRLKGPEFRPRLI